MSDGTEGLTAGIVGTSKIVVALKNHPAAAYAVRRIAAGYAKDYALRRNMCRFDPGRTLREQFSAVEAPIRIERRPEESLVLMVWSHA